MGVSMSLWNDSDTNLKTSPKPSLEKNIPAQSLRIQSKTLWLFSDRVWPIPQSRANAPLVGVAAHDRDQILNDFSENSTSGRVGGFLIIALLIITTGLIIVAMLGKDQSLESVELVTDITACVKR
ncbi:hypothetical protein M406DRAFT_333039 [Cryphonectria parasitica EP155]|uniref:Uncharacterized protein n=1 Tax=Cryphonectria parasitica (strain ATCC 38755 / EP155) TaxID=660469 RepID=A0A9P4XWM1_CRYP1|nr:uncharacterized protein M406DRAFT_333039 [Cryphonectria parasitica EP155]KAF3762667.1 hypothetical protein M406DRAFT_333039 [Cryphonectria parasitica EP155]